MGALTCPTHGQQLVVRLTSRAHEKFRAAKSAGTIETLLKKCVLTVDMEDGDEPFGFWIIGVAGDEEIFLENNAVLQAESAYFFANDDDLDAVLKTTRTCCSRCVEAVVGGAL